MADPRLKGRCPQLGSLAWASWALPSEKRGVCDTKCLGIPFLSPIPTPKMWQDPETLRMLASQALVVAGEGAWGGRFPLLPLRRFQKDPRDNRDGENAHSRLKQKAQNGHLDRRARRRATEQGPALQREPGMRCRSRWGEGGRQGGAGVIYGVLSPSPLPPWVARGCSVGREQRRPSHLAPLPLQGVPWRQLHPQPFPGPMDTSLLCWSPQSSRPGAMSCPRQPEDLERGRGLRGACGGQPRGEEGQRESRAEARRSSGLGETKSRSLGSF